MKKKSYIEIQHEVVEKYRIKIDTYSNCWSRTHAHLRERRVCKWDYKNSAIATFTLFHEIGHIERNNSKMRRYEQEFFATQWAIEKCIEYGIKVNVRTRELYDWYIQDELDRGLRRGGAGYDTELKLDWEKVVTL